VDAEHYRGDLTAALHHVEQLEAELAAFRADPAYERVEVAEEALARARGRARHLRRLLPRVLIASFVLTGAFALTDPAVAAPVRIVGYALAVLGASSTVVTIVALLMLSAQGLRPKRLLELERAVRLAKADVGMRHEARLRVLTTATSPEAVESDGHEILAASYDGLADRPSLRASVHGMRAK
jgi:hypothetical protein